MSKSPALILRGIHVRMRSAEVVQLRQRLAAELWRHRHRTLAHLWPDMPEHLDGIDRFAHFDITGDYENDERLLAYRSTVES
jgi:hypothetical protein